MLQLFFSCRFDCLSTCPSICVSKTNALEMVTSFPFLIGIKPIQIIDIGAGRKPTGLGVNRSKFQGGGSTFWIVTWVFFFEMEQNLNR